MWSRQWEWFLHLEPHPPHDLRSSPLSTRGEGGVAKAGKQIPMRGVRQMNRHTAIHAILLYCPLHNPREVLN